MSKVVTDLITKMVKWMIFQNKVLCETFKSYFKLSLNQFVTIWTRLFFKLIFPSVHHLSLCTYSYVIHSYIRMTNKQKKGRPFSCSVFLGQQFLYMKLIGYIIYLYISFEVAQRFFSSLFLVTAASACVPSHNLSLPENKEKGDSHSLICTIII